MKQPIADSDIKIPWLIFSSVNALNPFPASS